MNHGFRDKKHFKAVVEANLPLELAGAQVRSKSNVPVFLNYDYKKLIGRATVNGDTNIVTIEITDPRVAEALKPDLRGISIDVNPSRSTYESDTPYPSA